MGRYAFLAAVVLILFGSAFAGPGQGPRNQTPPPQQEDAASLRQRVEVLERELRAARLRIAELEAELDKERTQRRLEEEAEAASRPDAQPASPHQVLARLKDEYAAQFPEPPPDDPRLLRPHLRLLTQWVNMVNRAHRQRIDWACRIVSRDLIDADRAYVDLEAIDPLTGETVSDRFVIEWPRRLRPALARFVDGSPVRLRGLLTPDVRVNESRLESGVFDIPPLIGPYVEFRYSVQVTAVTAAEIGPPPGSEKPPVQEPQHETEPEPQR